MRPRCLLGFHSHQDYFWFYSRCIFSIGAIEIIHAICMPGRKLLTDTGQDSTATGRLSVHLFGKQQIIQCRQAFFTPNACHLHFITFPKRPYSYFCSNPTPAPQLPALPTLVHSSDEQLGICHRVLLPNNNSSNFHLQK